MVCIGYGKTIDVSRFTEFMSKYDMTMYDAVGDINGLFFIEVESAALRDRSLCCWGDYHLTLSETINQVSKTLPLTSQSICRDHMEKSRILLLSDAEFWVGFVRDFVKEFKKIGLYRYYPDMPDVQNPTLHRKLDLFRQDDILKLEPNQILIVE